MKYTNIQIVRVPEEEEKNKEYETPTKVETPISERISEQSSENQ